MWETRCPKRCYHFNEEEHNKRVMSYWNYLLNLSIKGTFQSSVQKTRKRNFSIKHDKIFENNFVYKMRAKWKTSKVWKKSCQVFFDFFFENWGDGKNFYKTICKGLQRRKTDLVFEWYKKNFSVRISSVDIGF